MISKADALFNTMEALRLNRVIHNNEPPSIIVNCGDAVNVEIISGWSKSSINNKIQTVFLIIPSDEAVAAMMPSAKVIYWGETAFVVRGVVEPPKELGSYWLLPVREA